MPLNTYIVLFFLTAPLLSQIQSVNIGHISGTLVTADSRPASSFNVDIIGVSPTSTYRVRTETKDDGSFDVAGLSLGDYVLAPYQEADASRYPAGTSSFYNPTPARLSLTANIPSQNVTIRLPAPNLIFSGTVVGPATEVIVATIQIEFADEPNRFIRFSTDRSGFFRVLIPANTRLKMITKSNHLQTSIKIVGPFTSGNDPHLDLSLQAESNH